MNILPEQTGNPRMNATMTLQYSQNVSHLHSIREAVRAFFSEFNITTRDQQDIDIIITELCTNAMTHGKSAQNRVNIVIHHTDGTAEFHVQDFGKGFDEDDVEQPGTERPGLLDDTPRIGGFGLPSIRMLTDSLIFQSTIGYGTKVQAIKTLEPRETQCH